eukprot:c17653_g1_i1.p1 GENE.c17653_g1_i1~~c17653_g1_i1.p1  ORF type:complete len:148 (+),score=24.01 c17653_g1_i1:406-849(+)
MMPQETTLVYQRQPCIRIHPPSDRPTGNKHRDSDYGHQPGQINFWLPLTELNEANTLWVEDGMESQHFFPILTPPGTVVRFYGNQLEHYTTPNISPFSRVSLDLRVVPGSLFDNDFGPSKVNDVQQFFVGERGYYTELKIDKDNNWL